MISAQVLQVVGIGMFTTIITSHLSKMSGDCGRFTIFARATAASACILDAVGYSCGHIASLSSTFLCMMFLSLFRVLTMLWDAHKPCRCQDEHCFMTDFRTSSTAIMCIFFRRIAATGEFQKIGDPLFTTQQKSTTTNILNTMIPQGAWLDM